MYEIYSYEWSVYFVPRSASETTPASLTSQATPLNLSATSTKTLLAASLINTPTISPSRTTDSQSLHGSSVTLGKNSSSLYTAVHCWDTFDKKWYPIHMHKKNGTWSFFLCLCLCRGSSRLFFGWLCLCLGLWLCASENLPLLNKGFINFLINFKNSSHMYEIYSYEWPVYFIPWSASVTAPTSLTSQTTPLNLSATLTKNMLTTSLINIPTINPSRTTDSQSLPGSIVTQGKNSSSSSFLYTAVHCWETFDETWHLIHIPTRRLRHFFP